MTAIVIKELITIPASIFRLAKGLRPMDWTPKPATRPKTKKPATKERMTKKEAIRYLKTVRGCS